MELKYEGRKFIGVVKFFDAVKGFGFIASNCCGMPDQNVYKQDFYIDTSSFPDGKHIREGGIVVFQIEQQSRSRVKAVNVRIVSKTDEDKELFLQYYDDYEEVELKEGTVNVFRHFRKNHSTQRILEIVAQRVENGDLRSIDRTVKLVSSLIGHFETRSVNGATQYVFDYDIDNHKQWVKFFKCLTKEEILELFKKYPTIAKFVKDETVITAWIAGYKEKELELSTLLMLKSCLEHLPKRKGTTLQKLINKNVDRLVKELIDKYQKRVTFNESEITNITKQFNALTGEDYEFLLIKCKDTCKINELRSALNQLKSTSRCGSDEIKVAQCYHNLSNEGQETTTPEIKEAIKEKISSLGDNGYVFEILEILKVFNFLGEDFTRPYYEAYQEQANESLLKTIEGDRVNDVKQIEGFINLYQEFFEENCSDELIAAAKQQLLSATSLYSLNEMYKINFWTDKCNVSFLTKEEIVERVKEVISDWSIREVNDFINSERDVFEKEDTLDISVINRAFDLIGNKSLSRSFGLPPFNSLFDTIQDLSSINDSSEIPADPDVMEKNCSFLKALGQLKGDDQTEQRWSNYIQSCDYQEKLALFRNGVISGSPQDVAEEIINGLTVNDFIDAESKLPAWLLKNIGCSGYKRPRLINEEQEKVLKSSNGLFEVVEKRVLSIELTPDNYSLVIFLLELVRLKLPEHPEYYKRKDWEKDLKNFINRLIFRSSDNPRMKTILWAVFFQSAASLKTLTEIFSDLPPYIQINAVKKLFQLIDQGKLNLNAESMYKLVGGGVKPLCFPLDITFTYLKLRSEKPNATLTNNIMLGLLEGRDDHKEWENISYLLHQCNGRIYVQDGDKTEQLRKYYNGTVKVTSNGIDVYIPETMCDIDGNSQEYNNKYFKAIQEYVKINFGINPINAREASKAYKFHFNKDQQIEVFNMAWVFNLCYRDRYERAVEYNVRKDEYHQFCEARHALKLDNEFGEPFYWCRGYPCFRTPVRFMMNSEWANYTILDFMRILNIPVDYVSSKGVTRFGHYIMLSSFMLSFKKFYNHLECRSCKKLMKPNDMSNFATRAVTEFSCANEECENFGKVVYLNHCFNRKNCNATIDSRDSKQCPNGQYICPECGACCSTQNFANRLSNLRLTGGAISPWLENFVNSDLGHWEKNEFYCYKCGNKLVDGKCPDCGTTY